jgi:hypothetical protein
MLEPQTDRIFIRLISDLAKPSTVPSAWEPVTDADVFRTSQCSRLQVNMSIIAAL